MSSKPSLCFFNTSAAMPHMLLGEGPARSGGAQVRASIVARALAERGWPVTFVIRDYGQPAETFTAEGIRVLKASGQKQGLPLLRVLTHTIPADMRAVGTADADIHIEFGLSWRTGLLVREAHKRRRRFMLWLAHILDPQAGLPGISMIPSHWRWSAIRGLAESDMVIAQTHEQAVLMQKLHGRTCPVVPNVWVLTESHGPKSDPPEVLWAARYLPLKRPEWVLEIAQRLPDVRFVMAGGPGEGQDALFSQIQQAAASIPNVDVLGFVPFSEIDQYYARASALLCTSTVEGFPNTFLQAWNHRTPVVSTFDPDGVLARHGVGIACNDVEELVGGIQRVCGAEGAALGERCRAYLEQVHSGEAVMNALEPLLAALV